jgi:hypothetical protein
MKDIFARASGGMVGIALAVTVPHIGCIVPVLIAAGASAGAVTGGLYTSLASMAVASAWYGFRPCRKPSCVVFGETGNVRLRKGLAMAGFGFAVAAIGYSVFSDPIGIEKRAEYLADIRDSGLPISYGEQALETICAPGQP